ncbi:conjugal transfer protein TraL [Heyndrickxia sporothermodurans]|uniref:conjugal transfer protein TrbL family protein n=1 Tax=Heyndrickxia sporothermodurans TaxID=46224 RepID=UPI002DB73700|nr:conjugal transfer protein TrbL family protein [Heyndrickxia sporothermodurans]MEB6550212.1 conjugal transfer protein TraL [Heyndrickxia sporothermodurans]
MNNKKKWIKILLTTLLFLVAFNFVAPKSFADTGDFYKDNKKAIEKKVKSKTIRKMIKNYDYDTNTFDCGTLDVMCKLNGFGYSAYIGIVKKTFNGLDIALVKPEYITKNKTFKKYKDGFNALSSSMLVVFLMWQMVKLIAQRYADAEDGMVAINDKLLTVAGAAILLGIYTNFFEWILKFQAYAVEGILKDSIKTKDVVLALFTNAEYGMLLAFFIMLAFLIFPVIFMYRFILFGFLYITGVIAIPTMVNDEYNYFSIWLRLLVNNGITLFLQLLAFIIGITALIKTNDFSNYGGSFLVAMGFFMLAVAVPSLLGNLGASSGVSRGIGTAARHVMRR